MSPAPRAVVNPHRRQEHVMPPHDTDVLGFHRQLRDYRPTALHRFDRCGDDDGTVLVKDESDRLGLPAFKILGASWALERTLRARPQTAVVVAASAGNHGRAVARAAARRGVSCRILLPATASAARAERIADEGADVVRVDGDYDAAVACAERAAEEPRAALLADTGTAPSAAWVIDGYATLFHEAAAQAAHPFDVVLVPIGVGSLAAAAVRFAVHRQPAAHVVGVEPAAARCVSASLTAGRPVTVATSTTTMSGMNCATPSAAAWPTLHAGLTGTVAVTDGEAHEAMRALAARGVTAGDCGAATVAAVDLLRADPSCAALRAVVGLHRPSRVLCVSTEGATDPAAYQRVVSS